MDQKRKDVWLKRSLLIGLAISSGLIVSCATPPDVPICVRLSQDRGWCTYTVSEQEVFVDNDKQLLNGQTWAEIYVKSLVLPADSQAQLKAYIVKQCKNHNDCGGDLGKWERKTERISEVIVGATQ
jgi:hypothetical protein